MKCIVSSSNKLITCHIPTVLGTCTTGSWCHVWAALFCRVEESFVTSSSTWEGKSPFHLHCFLCPYLSSTAWCTCVSHPPPVHISFCGVAASHLCAQILLPAVLVYSNPVPLATHLLCQKDVESKATYTEYHETVLKWIYSWSPTAY